VKGWYEIPDRIANQCENSTKNGYNNGKANPIWGVFARIYFIGSVMVMGIIGLSLANAIFIDEMTVDNTQALENKVDALQAEIRSLRDEMRASRKGE
jgi:voltage-gated sodium channel